MALIAFHERMGADKREPVLVVLDSLDRHLPSFDRVAALAVGTELAAVNVRVALGALGAGLFEHQACVALNARNLRVHAP